MPTTYLLNLPQPEVIMYEPPKLPPESQRYFEEAYERHRKETELRKKEAPKNWRKK